jgi:nucleotide-binding universal stress UspA family protein
MTTSNTKRPFTVIVGVDFSDTSALALVEAVKAARSRDANHVHVVHSILPVPTAGPMGAAYVTPVVDTTRAADELKQFVEKALAEAQKSFPNDGRPFVDRLTTHLGVSDPREAIAQLASDVDADLIVIGTHGRRGVSRFLLGSVAEGVVRIAPCPVLVVRPRGTAASKVPEIEPPCPKCVEARRASEGRDFWCAQHREHHDRRHTYHFGPVRSGHQSGLLIPLFH